MRELAPAALELVADPDAPDALALREHATGAPIVPASLARLRSATAPAGIARLLVGLEPVAPARVLGAAARPARAS